MKGSGNGVTVSAGNVFIFKKEKDKRVTFRLENKALKSLAVYFSNRPERFRVSHAGPSWFV